MKKCIELLGWIGWIIAVIFGIGSSALELSGIIPFTGGDLLDTITIVALVLIIFTLYYQIGQLEKQLKKQDENNKSNVS